MHHLGSTRVLVRVRLNEFQNTIPRWHHTLQHQYTPTSLKCHVWERENRRIIEVSHILNNVTSWTCFVIITRSFVKTHTRCFATYAK